MLHLVVSCTYTYCSYILFVSHCTHVHIVNTIVSTCYMVSEVELRNVYLELSLQCPFSLPQRLTSVTRMNGQNGIDTLNNLELRQDWYRKTKKDKSIRCCTVWVRMPTTCLPPRIFLTRTARSTQKFDSHFKVRKS